MYHESRTEKIRRGVCLLNAARYDEAIAELTQTVDAPRDADPLRCYIASMSLGWTRDQALDRSISALRRKIAADAENPELHFQLGALLANADRLEEAELRFTQALSINRDHVDALVCLALCHQLRCDQLQSDLNQGIPLLRRAQSLRPGDPHITLLLAKAVKSCHDHGRPVDLCAAVAND